MNDTTHRAIGPYIDGANLVLGAVLFISPWLFGFAAQSSAAWNAWICGFVVAGLAIAALVSFAEWEEWINAALGLWIAVSPWVFGFADLAGALWSHAVLGLVIAGLAAGRGWLAHAEGTHAAA